MLREKDATTQAGFSAESMPASVSERPILFMDGDEHRTHRAKVARFFAPRTVANRYRELMEDRADVLVAEAVAATTFRLDHLTLRYSTEVAAQVIGLTNSNVDGMARRLERLFVQPDRSPHSMRKAGRLKGLWRTVRAHLAGVTAPVLLFRSRTDHVVDSSSAAIIIRDVGSKEVQEVMLERSYHVATLDYDAPVIFEGCADFLAAHLR